MTPADAKHFDAANGRVNAVGYSLSSLRRLHRSHLPKRGPFSICMHRPDAMTISYTEVAVSKQRATMRYKSAPPCSNGANVTRDDFAGAFDCKLP